MLVSRLSAANINSTVTAPGRQIIAILPYKPRTRVSFEWAPVQVGDGENTDGSFISCVYAPTSGKYVVPPKATNGSFIAGVSLESRYSMNFNYTSKFVGSNPSNYMNTDIYEVLPTGLLKKLGR